MPNETWRYGAKEIQRFLIDPDYQLRVMATLYEVENLFPRGKEEKANDLSTVQ